MSTITFNLRNGRTEEDIYRDTATVNGYKSTIIEKAVVSYKPTEGEYRTFTTNEGTFYEIDSEVPNPETEHDFGKRITVNSFNLQDAELDGKATTLMAKKEYNI